MSSKSSTKKTRKACGLLKLGDHIKADVGLHCLDMNKARLLPAWIREGLDKMDKEKQRKLQKEQEAKEKEERKKKEEEDRLKREEEAANSTDPEVLRRSRFVSENFCVFVCSTRCLFLSVFL